MTAQRLRGRLTRRGLLASLWPAVAWAVGDRPVAFGRLVVPGLRDPRPGALATLLKEVSEHTSVETEPAPRDVDPETPALFEQPFLVLCGDAAFEPLSDRAVERLRRFLTDGGILLIDDASGVDGSPFDRCVRRDVARILPGAPLEPIGRDHAVYRSFFMLRVIAGRVLVRPHLEGVWQGDITPILYSRNDVLGALQPSGRGGWALEPVPGGDVQRSESRKLAINLAMFALTGNYKRDVVHVEALLDRMRRQGRYGE